MARARNFQQLVDLIRQAETQLIGHGVADPSIRLLMLRGIYYGTPWSTDQSVERSMIRNIGFTIFTGIQIPPDPRPALGNSLFRDLQSSQDVRDRGRLIDVGHALIGLDARRSSVARTLEIPTQGGTGLELVTWLGDLGGGAANLAWCRASTPNRSVSNIFSASGSDYGASINLEGDIAAYVIGSTGGALDAPIFRRGDGIVDLFERYLPISRTASGWQRRGRDFVQMIGGRVSGSSISNRSTLITQLTGKIETFAVAYMMQRYIPGQCLNGPQIEAACQHLHGAAREVAAVFVSALTRLLIRPGRAVSGSRPWPRPTARGSCTSAALQATVRALDHARTIELTLQGARQDAERYLRELLR